jgi:hypothetical protein
MISYMISLVLCSYHILTPLSLSPACRRPVLFQEGPLNEFFLYVLEDLHTSQSLGALQFTSADPVCVMETVERVYPVQVQRRPDFLLLR